MLFGGWKVFSHVRALFQGKKNFYDTAQSMAENEFFSLSFEMRKT